MVDSCQVCHNQQDNQYHQIREMMFGTREPFTYLECSACQTIQLVDVPEDMGPYYPVDYYSQNQLVPSPFYKNILKTIRIDLYRHFPWKMLGSLYGDWIRETGISKKAKIADIGCGSGQLLYEWSASGFEDLWGYDPFMENPGQVNNRLTLEKKDIFGIREEETFDLVMLHHAFEHMDRPLEVLKKAYSLLKPGGQLLIRIPVADAAVWKTYGTDWLQLDAPRHLFIHSKKSMQLMADKAGFGIEKVIFDSTGFQFWGTELYKRDIQLKGTDPAKHFSSAQMKKWEDMAKDLNAIHKGDQAAFYLRKG